MKKTIKLPILLSEDQQKIVLNYQQNQNNLIRYTYNRLRANPDLKTAEITALQKTMHHIFVDSHFKNSATYKANSLLRENECKVIFGGKTLFLQRCQNKISKEDFQIQKLVPLISIGESPQKGNRKFALVDPTKILFKPTKAEHLEITLPFLKKNLKKDLEKLIALQNKKTLPITYELTTNYIYITYDDEIVNSITNYHGKHDRIMAIDLNPNFIGYSIIDWKKNSSFNLISNGLFDLTHFSQKSKELKKIKYELKKLGKDGEERTNIIRKKIMHLNGQRNHETVHIAIQLFNIFKNFHCSLFGMEDLDIKSKENDKGKHYNRLVVNEWLRYCLVNQVQKRMDRIGAKVVKVIPNYSSFVGNVLYKEMNLPDPILSSIEINRRVYEFHAQYIEKSKPKIKVIMFPNFDTIKGLLAKPLEGFGSKIDSVKDWIRLYGFYKNSKVKYRVTLESVQNSRDFSEICIKNKVKLYNFT